MTVEAPANTFLFADLAGFTALTEVHGDDQAADLAADFSASVRRLLPEHEAEDVKAIGDALMLRGRAAPLAVRLGVRIVHDVGEQHGIPSVRVGMHTGRAVERDGDWFGTTVNVAARVSALAGGGDVLLTEATRAVAGELVDIEMRERGRQSLKNVAEPLMLYEAVGLGERARDALPIDPVCRMGVDPAHSAGSLRHDGVEYLFCSLRCAAAFAGEPQRYVSVGTGTE